MDDENRAAFTALMTQIIEQFEWVVEHCERVIDRINVLGADIARLEKRDDAP